MNWVLHQSISPTNENLLSPPPPPRPVSESNLENKISPSILLIIVILAVIFFISGLLHLLVRYLLRPTNRDPEDSEDVTALQGQLQQLFHLHDSGVDQSFIDTLPVFLYKAIIGLKDPFDCAVCLCEFESDDKLRLLPKCSHAFHIECIDTWLLSHSTCPLCRSNLVPEFSPNHSCSPVVLVLESGSESSREIGIGSSQRRGEFDQNSHMGFLQEDDFGPPVIENSTKVGEFGGKEDVGSSPIDVSDTKVVQVKLGKFTKADNSSVCGGEGSSAGNSNLDQRRCFSMGSYEYVMNEASFLQVAIKPSKKKPNRFKKPGYAMSECDCHSRREGFDSSKRFQSKEDSESARISSNKRESFSVSKIWLRSKKDKATSEDSSRRAFSFRLPLHNEASNSKAKSSVSPRTVSEFGVDMDLDVEVGSCNNSIMSMGSQIEEAPSFARRTLLWIVGRQNKVGNHSMS